LPDQPAQPARLRVVITSVGDSAALRDRRFRPSEVHGATDVVSGLFVHIMYLVGFRNRLVVFIEWAYSYFTYRAGVRLITDVERYKPPAS